VIAGPTITLGHRRVPWEEPTDAGTDPALVSGAGFMRFQKVAQCVSAMWVGSWRAFAEKPTSEGREGRRHGA